MFADARFACRQLLKKPGFTAVVLLTLALCIGANTAIFSMVYALLLKPLPFAHPTRIVEIYNTFHKAGLDKMPSNVIQYDDYKRNTSSYDAVALLGQSDAMVGEEGHADRVTLAYASADIFNLLELKPVIGQFFTLKNDEDGNGRVVVLTESYWKSHYHADPGVLGQKLIVDGDALQIVGVAPEAFSAFTARVKFIKPMTWKPADIDPMRRFGLGTPLFARLKAGVSPQQALSEAQAVEKRYYDWAPSGYKTFLDRAGYKIAVGLVQTEKVQPVRSSLLLLQGGVVFVLLIGCVNIANLLLTRANARQSELALRTALGAGRWAIARQLLVESLVLTLAGAVLGVLFAWTAVGLINHYSAKLMPDMLPFALDGQVLGYALALSVTVGLLIGIIPVVHTLRSDLAGLIHRSSRSVAGNRGVRALSSLLVTAQVAVALILLTGAGLLIHSFANALAVNPGIDPAHVVAGELALPQSYGKQETNTALQQRLLTKLREIPGVESAALSNAIPFRGGLNVLALALRDSTLAPNSAQPAAYLVGASAGYFQTMHIQLLEGRLLDERDDAKGARQAYVVDERFEKMYFPGRSAVGGNFSFNSAPKDWPVIVGVVRNVPHNGVEDRSNQPFVYYPLLATAPTELSLFVRSTRDPGDLTAALREKIAEVDPGIALFNTTTLATVVSEALDNRRAVMFLLGAFAALALFLSAIGIYGVLAYDVSQRTREIGVRGAIGASRGQIVGLIMRQGLWKTGAGLVIGLVGAVLLSHTMASLLFDLKPTDPWAYVLVSVLLAVTALLASYLPARNASRIEPIEALRFE
jgi:putative ABC transport system permease protein